MTGPTTGFALEDRDGTPLLAITVPGVVVRLFAVAPIAIAVAALHRVAPPDTPWWPSVLLVLLAALSAGLPDSGAGLATLAGLVAWWLTAVREPEVWWGLLVAGCALVFHATLAHAAAGPSGCAPTGVAVLRMARRCGGVLAATAGLAALVEATEEWGEPPVLVVGVTLALVGVLPWLAARRSEQG